MYNIIIYDTVRMIYKNKHNLAPQYYELIIA